MEHAANIAHGPRVDTKDTEKAAEDPTVEHVESIFHGLQASDEGGAASERADVGRARELEAEVKAPAPQRG